MQTVVDGPRKFILSYCQLNDFSDGQNAAIPNPRETGKNNFDDAEIFTDLVFDSEGWDIYIYDSSSIIERCLYQNVNKGFIRKAEGQKLPYLDGAGTRVVVVRVC